MAIVDRRTGRRSSNSQQPEASPDEQPQHSTFIRRLADRLGGGSQSDQSEPHWIVAGADAVSEAHVFEELSAGEIRNVLSPTRMAQGLDELLIRGRDIVELHELSGLTWAQLARLFGVSSAALHGWANGAPINDRHHYVLSNLLRRVRGLAGDSKTRKVALLAPRIGRLSIYDELRGNVYPASDLLPDYAALESKESAE